MLVRLIYALRSIYGMTPRLDQRQGKVKEDLILPPENIPFKARQPMIESRDCASLPHGKTGPAPVQPPIPAAPPYYAHYPCYDFV